MNFEEQMKQINICGIGPLRISRALLQAKLVKGSIIIITSQAGSTEWRFTQCPDGGDYGHHMSRAACNMGGEACPTPVEREPSAPALLHSCAALQKRGGARASRGNLRATRRAYAELTPR